MVAEIVGVGAIDHVREPQLLPDLLGQRVELALAVKAAVVGVRRVARVVHLLAMDDAMARPERPRDPLRILALALGHRGAPGGHAQRLVAEHVVRDREHERAVQTAAVGDHDRAEPVHRLAELGQLGVPHGPNM
jgi:hypothetical protein